MISIKEAITKAILPTITKIATSAYQKVIQPAVNWFKPNVLPDMYTPTTTPQVQKAAESEAQTAQPENTQTPDELQSPTAGMVNAENTISNLEADPTGNYNASAEAELQREWTATMSNTAHQREVSDLKAAGLNPVLSAGGTGASSSGGAVASPSTETSAGRALTLAQANLANIQAKYIPVTAIGNLVTGAAGALTGGFNEIAGGIKYLK